MAPHSPPLESFRTVLSLAVSEIGSHKPNTDPMSPKRTQLSFVDIKRAYFNAVINPKDPPTSVSFPSEDGDHSTMCGQLLRHMVLCSPSSMGRLTEVGGSFGLTTALGYARFMSTKLNCVRFGDIGSVFGLCDPISDTTKLRTVRSDSNGGAGAKNEAPLMSCAFI